MQKTNSSLAVGSSWSIILISISVVALVPLSVEIFRRMNTDVIRVSAILVGVGLIGSCICSIASAVQDDKPKKKQSGKSEFEEG